MIRDSLPIAACADEPGPIAGADCASCGATSAIDVDRGSRAHCTGCHATVRRCASCDRWTDTADGYSSDDAAECVRCERACRYCGDRRGDRRDDRGDLICTPCWLALDEAEEVVSRAAG